MDSDSFNQLTLTAGMPWRLVVVLRAYCRYLLQTGLPVQPGLHRAGAGQQSGDRARSRGPVRRALRPRHLRHGAPRSALARLDQRIRSKLEEVTRSDEDRILRALWNALSATVRTNAYQLVRARPAQGLSVLQDREPEAARAAAAEAHVRDLRVLDPHGGRASAHGFRRARRHPLVGPARGFPHRSARPHEGAAGQEHRHRAGRRQGRLRGAARPDGRSRRAARRGGRLLPDADPRHARPHRQHRRGQDRRRRRGWCATTATMPTWWWRRTRARRPSRTSPTRSPRNTDSGSAMPSPRAARPATTTRKWRSPRAARGNASSGISARSASTFRARISRSPASATWRATCSATACCSRRTSGWSRPSTISTSSSIRIRIAARSFKRARASVPPAALLAGRITRRRPSPRAAACTRAAPRA